MYQFRKLKTSNSKLLLIAVFIFFTINNANIFFRGIPFLVKFLKGTFLYQLFLTSVITICVLFFKENKEVLTNKYNQFFATNSVLFNSLRNIALSLFVGGMLGFLSFFLFQKIQLPFPERSIVIEFKDSIEVNQPWQLYLHTLAGYSPLESVERSPIGNSITFPISGNTTFSKLRLDPGDQRVEQTFTIDKIKLKKQNEVLEEINGPALTSFLKPIQHINSFKFDKETGGLKISSANQGDPQLDLNLSYLSLDPVQITNRKRLIGYAIFVTLLVFFTFLYRYKFIRYFSSLSTNYSLLSKLAFALIISLGAFLTLQKRASILPLRILTVHLGAEMEVPQDNWKIYLNIEGYKEAHSVTGLKLGSKIYFPIRTNRPFSDIRVDPGTSEQKFEVDKITFSSGLEQVNLLQGKDLFSRVGHQAQIKNLSLGNTNKYLLISTFDKGDPNLILQLDTSIFKDQSYWFELLIAAITGVSLLIVILLWNQRNKLFTAHEKKIALGVFFINVGVIGYTFFLLNDINYLLLCFNLLWLFVLPGNLVKDLVGFKTHSIVSNYVVSLAIGIGLILLPLFTFYAFNIPNADNNVYILAGVLSLCFLIKSLFALKNRSFVSERQPILSYRNAIELSFFSILFFVFISPIGDLLCAPLHDPAVTSTMAHKIIASGFVKSAIASELYTYPPNLPLLAALLSKISLVIAPKVVLFMTNFFTVLIGLAFGFFWSRYFNNTISSFVLSLLLIMFVSPKIPEMYFTGGKNATVISMFFWFVAFYLAWQTFQSSIKQNLFQGSIITLVLITGFLFHYITFITFPVIIAFFLFKFFEEDGFWKRKVIIRYLFLTSSFLLPGLIFGGIFYKQEKSVLEVSQHQINNRPTVSKIEQPKTGVTNDEEKVTVSLSEKLKGKLLKVSTFLKTSYQKTQGFLMLYGYFAYDYSNPNSFFKYQQVAYLSLLFLLYAFLFLGYKREVTLLFLLGLAIYLMVLSSSFNIALYGKTMRFLIPILTATFVLNVGVLMLRKKKNILFGIFMIVTLLSLKNILYLTYNYHNSRPYSLLTKADLNAFTYIDNNLSDKGDFLTINMAGLEGAATMPIDGGLYLNMTHAESALPFVPGKKFYMGSMDFSYLRLALLRWVDEEKGAELLKKFELANYPAIQIESTKDLPKKMKELGVKFIYNGLHAPWGRQIGIEQFKDSPYFSLIYDQEGIKIYELQEYKM